METVLSRRDTKLSEIYLEIIIESTKNLNSGNVAHKAASIKNHAEAIKRLIQTNKPEPVY